MVVQAQTGRHVAGAAAGVLPDDLGGIDVGPLALGVLVLDQEGLAVHGVVTPTLEGDVKILSSIDVFQIFPVKGQLNGKALAVFNAVQRQGKAFGTVVAQRCGCFGGLHLFALSVQKAHAHLRGATFKILIEITVRYVLNLRQILDRHGMGIEGVRVILIGGDSGQNLASRRKDVHGFLTPAGEPAAVALAVHGAHCYHVGAVHNAAGIEVVIDIGIARRKAGDHTVFLANGRGGSGD